jgi:hypothetical protein
MNLFEEIIFLSRLPETKSKIWLEGATHSVDFLKHAFRGDDIILYASGPHFYVHSVLAPNTVLDPPDHDDLAIAYLRLEDSWCIQRSFGGGEGHHIYLEPPLASPGCNSLVDGEKLIFVRNFDGVRDHRSTIEISQKLIHALDIHYMYERNAYCRLNKRGDFENVISFHSDNTHDPWKRVRAVTIRAHDLAKYMALGDMSLVAKFDFTRFLPKEFSDWGEADRQEYRCPDLYYQHQINPGRASYANGQIILRTKLTEVELVAEWQMEDDPSNRRYATFKIIDRKNGKQAETSCSPDHIVNYFTESDLPWEISPAFFRPEVLQKYKADSEKYTLEDRSITCRNAWYLRSYDINKAGQVHAYISDLADLPFEEQLYWQSFNEWPKASISKRAYQNDILGEFSTESDPLSDLKVRIRELDSAPPSWWQPRGSELISELHYPATDSVTEWGNELLALDHLIVEGFLQKPLRAIADANGGSYETGWGSLKLLELVLSVTGRTDEQAKALIAPLRKLSALRNKVKSHANTEGKKKEVADSRKAHGTLRKHFEDLTERIEQSMGQIQVALPEK